MKIYFLLALEDWEQYAASAVIDAEKMEALVPANENVKSQLV
jgi:hypothetical protein